MFFEFNPTTELLTPNIDQGGVSKHNPLFTSNGVFPTEENDSHFPPGPPQTGKYESATNDNLNEIGDNNPQQYDLFSTFELPVLAELEDFQYEKYLSQTPCATEFVDVSAPLTSEDSTFYPVDDSTTSWVGSECTIESPGMEDMLVPPSPTPSSASGSSSVMEKRVTKKRGFTTTERRLRKKDQNKAAAEKYRTKKKLERNELASRHADLKNQNQELKFELDNISFRLEQFKQLFIDVLQIPIPPTK